MKKMTGKQELKATVQRTIIKRRFIYVPPPLLQGISFQCDVNSPAISGGEEYNFSVQTKKHIRAGNFTCNTLHEHGNLDPL